MFLSVVIPVYNEEENIVPLLTAVDEALAGVEHEVILVDDGSTDQTIPMIKRHAGHNVRLVAFARNFGQTSAIAAGIDEAQGEFIATLDGDLQNDPRDIPMMLEKLQREGLDIVAGRRANRQDDSIRKIPSKIANYLIRRLTNVQVRDYGCTLKLFRAELAKRLDLYGELHRFIPILGSIQGAKIAEVDVRHHARRFGVSKYGLGRTLKVASDLLLMYFFLKYRQKPMHLFGTVGLGMFLLGTAIQGYLLLVKLFGGDIGTRPLFFVGIVLIITSIQLVTTGFIAELLMRTYYSADRSTPYRVGYRWSRDG